MPESIHLLVQPLSPSKCFKANGIRTDLFSAIAILVVFCSFSTAAQTPVLTQHNDNARSGQNTNETILTTSNVNVNQFGKLFALPVDGQVYAQPLYVPGVTINGAKHNVLIVATENDSVYAFDADSNTAGNSSPLWKASMVDAAHGAGSGETALNALATINCTDLQPQIGISSTPVIDPITNTVYVEAKSTNGSNYYHRLHSLDLFTGNEKSPGPTLIAATVSGTGDGSSNGQLVFNSNNIALHEHNRVGLLLVNGTIFIAFGSHCDDSPYHGWLFAYDEPTLTEKSVYVTTPNGGLGGFWMGGSGIAADSSGNIFIASGNGDFDTVNVPATETGDTILKLGTANQNLTLLDYFTPEEQATLDADDRDLGSGGVLLLPAHSGSDPLLVEAGKEGRIYVIDQTQMTTTPPHYCSGCTSDPEIVEESALKAIGGFFSCPTYWNNNIYFWGTKDVLKSVPIVSGLPNFSDITSNSTTLGFPGAGLSVSSNGSTASTAIVWAIDGTQYGSPGPGPGPAVIHAYEATNVSTELWNSTQAANSRDQAGNAVKFAVPTISNGKVYVGTSTEVDVYGLLTAAVGPQITSVSPTSGPAGTAVTITGTNFGSAQGASTVTFNGTAATVTSWSTTSIATAVPSGATTGNVVVTVGGTASNGVSFTVTVSTPTITNLNPTSGPVGTAVTITGTDFGSTQGSSAVTFNGTAATVTSWSTTSIATKVPTGATTGSVVVTVGGVASNGLSFTITTSLPTPTITGLNPTSGAIGAAVTISGANFGSSQGSSTVAFDGTAATVTSWSTASIATKVPTGATTGSVVVTVGGVASNGMNFTVAPTVTALSPNAGPAGTAVTITGTNFGSTQGSSTVTFNGTAATVASWSQTSIATTVPSGATSGYVVVTVGGMSSNGVSFAVSLICGETGQSGTDSKNADWTFTAPCVTGTNANGYAPASVQYWVGTPSSASFDFGIYSDNAGSPGTLLCHTGTTTVTPDAGWNNVPLAGAACPALAASTQYWIGYITGSNTIQQGTVTGNCPGTSLNSVYASIEETSSVLSNTFGAATKTPYCYSMYLLLNSPPVVSSLSPSSGPVGTTVIIAGTNFGSTQGNSTITFNGTTAAVSSWTATTIITTVPSGATTGNVVLTVGGVASNGVSFTVTAPAPTVSSLSPTSGAVGTPVTITGTNFGSSQGNSTVKFNGTAAAVTTWSPTTIATTVPAGATTGSVVVTVGGLASNGANFTVTASVAAPTITSVNPTSGSVAAAITITGMNFGSTQGSSTVTFNGTTATVTSWSATSIATTVPTGATSGNVVVTVGGLASNGVSFAVTVICGETGQSGTDWQNSDWAFGTPCVTGTNANGYTLASVQYWVGNASSTSFDLGIYADSAGSPGTLLCHTGTTTITPSAGWNSISLSGKGCPALTSSTRYWIGYLTGSNTIQQGIVGGTCPGTSLKSVYASSQEGSAVLPSSFGATSGTPSCYSMYLVLDMNGSGVGQDPSGQLVALSSNGKYLINSSTGQPVFIVGDGAFDLCCMLDSSDVTTYLNDRANKGFNAIWMVAVDNGFSSNPPKNFNGNSPFDGADFTNFDSAYWANIDSIIQQAGSLGITVFLNPFFPGNGAEPGYLNSVLATSDATMSAYGTFLGTRYKGYNNIVWLLGGDSLPSTSGLYQKLNDVGTSIAAADPNHLITLEACEQCVTNGYNSVQAYQAQSLAVPSWLTLNWAYPQLTTTVAAAQNSYNQSPFLPPLCGENFYELDYSITEPNVRFEMYSEILSGCYVGRIFGNGAIWSFDSPNGDNCCRGGSPTWQSQLPSPGSVAQEYQGQLFQSREHWLLIPDISHTVVTAGYGSGLTITTTARTSDGQTIIAYIPNGNATTIAVNMTKITSSTSTVQAWWFNPQTGVATSLGTFPNSGSLNFTAPDSNDWVLVLDDASASLPAPGSGSAP